jgi:hypothetical protein
MLAPSDEEVVWLNVSMEEASRVNELYSLNHLISDHENGLERKLPFAVTEEILEGRA